MKTFRCILTAAVLLAGLIQPHVPAISRQSVRLPGLGEQARQDLLACVQQSALEGWVQDDGSLILAGPAGRLSMELADWARSHGVNLPDLRLPALLPAEAVMAGDSVRLAQIDDQPASLPADGLSLTHLFSRPALREPSPPGQSEPLIQPAAPRAPPTA